MLFSKSRQRPERLRLPCHGEAEKRRLPFGRQCGPCSLVAVVTWLFALRQNGPQRGLLKRFARSCLSTNSCDLITQTSFTGSGNSKVTTDALAGNYATEKKRWFPSGRPRLFFRRTNTRRLAAAWFTRLVSRDQFAGCSTHDLTGR